MNLDISYQIVGEGDPVIFIHGIGSKKTSWNSVVNELKKQFLCITYDLRGHGDSKDISSDFNLNDLVEDIEKIRSHLDIDKMHLVGHSLGGMIGPAYTKKYPNKKKISQSIFCVFSVLLINRRFTDIFIQQNQNIINKRIEQIKNTPISVFLKVFRIYALTEMSSWLASIKTPCLVMTGEYDIGCSPEINKQIVKTIPNSKLKIINIRPQDYLDKGQILIKIMYILKSVRK